MESSVGQGGEIWHQILQKKNQQRATALTRHKLIKFCQKKSAKSGIGKRVHHLLHAVHLRSPHAAAHFPLSIQQAELPNAVAAGFLKITIWYFWTKNDPKSTKSS